MKKYTLICFLLFNFGFLFSQKKSIILNGEKFKASEWSNTGIIEFPEKQGELNVYRSPFFDQGNPQKIDNDTSLTHIAYSFLGHICDSAALGNYVIDFQSHHTVLNLFFDENYDAGWDSLVIIYFQGKLSKVSDAFKMEWDKLKTSAQRKSLLNNKLYSIDRAKLYNLFLVREDESEFMGISKKQTALMLDLKGEVNANLDAILKGAKNVSKSDKNKIKAQAELAIEKEFSSNQIVKLRYYSYRFNGDFLNLVRDFANSICEKKKNTQTLSPLESKFYTQYIKIKFKTFFITHIKYIAFSIDKTTITKMIRTIQASIDVQLALKNIESGSGTLGVEFWRRKEINISTSYASDGGYILQLAESGIVAFVQCK